MNKFIFFLSLMFLFVSCKSEKTTPQILVENSKEVHLTEPTMIIVSLDEEQLYEMQDKYGEIDFFKLADDLGIQLNEVNRKMEELNIPTFRASRDTLTVHTEISTETIIKDSTFSIFTYFLFDGETLKRKEYKELKNMK